MFAVRVAHASTGIEMPLFSLYSSTSAVMYRARTCKSPTRPAVVRPMLSSSLYTFLVRLWAIRVPAVARRSAARTTPSLQTRPSVVVPVSTSLETVAIRTLPFKTVSKTTAEEYGRQYLRIGSSVANARRRHDFHKEIRLHLDDNLLIRGIDLKQPFEIPTHFSRGIDEGQDQVDKAELLKASKLLPHDRDGNPEDPAHFARGLGAPQEPDQNPFRFRVESDLHGRIDLGWSV